MAEEKKHLVQDAQYPYPHIGSMIKKVVRRSDVNREKLAARMGIQFTTFMRSWRQPSVQAGSLWKAGLALKHNFFEELAREFPFRTFPPEVEAAVARERSELEAQHTIIIAEKDAAIEVLQRRVAALESQIAVYREVIGLGKQ